MLQHLTGYSVIFLENSLYEVWLKYTLKCIRESEAPVAMVTSKEYHCHENRDKAVIFIPRFQTMWGTGLILILTFHTVQHTRSQ